MGVSRREQIVNDLVHKSIKLGHSNYSLLEYVKSEYDYENSYAYELLKEARERIGEIQKDQQIKVFEKAVANLEQQLEQAKKENAGWRAELEIQKELNKISGLYTEKIDLSIAEYKVKFGGSE